MSEEEYPDDEYIDNENDPCGFDEIEDETIPLFKEEKIGFDEVVGGGIELKIENLSNHDHMMEEKVLDALRKGKLK